ncbi:MAG: envelope stress response membrane protein PspB [Vibrionaceae bacterium]
MSGLFLFPLSLFLLFVAPLWLWLHYRNRRLTGSHLNAEQLNELRQLSQQIEQLQQRVNTLERILDASTSQWRER